MIQRESHHRNEISVLEDIRSLVNLSLIEISNFGDLSDTISQQNSEIKDLLLDISNDMDLTLDYHKSAIDSLSSKSLLSLGLINLEDHLQTMDHNVFIIEDIFRLSEEGKASTHMFSPTSLSLKLKSLPEDYHMRRHSIFKSSEVKKVYGMPTTLTYMEGVIVNSVTFLPLVSEMSEFEIKGIGKICSRYHYFQF